MDGPTSPYPVLYPVMLRLEGQPCLVVGGGRVAAAKVRGLAACGASVTVVAPRLSAELVELSAGAPGDDPGRRWGPVTLQRRPYRPGEVLGYRLVVAATSDGTVNRRVTGEADAAGIWANSADDPSNCAFFLPSVHRDGPLTVSVSTAGTSPAVAAWLRRRLASDIGPEIAVIAGLFARARADLRRAGGSTEGVDWSSLLDGPLPELVRQGRLEEAARLVTEVAEGPGSVPAGGPS